VRVRLAVAAAIARTRDAAGPAWRALIQVAVGPDPVPAWRSPWQRRVALGLAVATGVAIMFSVFAMHSARPPGTGQIRFLKVSGSPRADTGHYAAAAGLLQSGSPWLVTLLALVTLAGVLPLPMAISRPLLGWRIGWLALLAAPWTGISWDWASGSWPWEPVQVAVLAVVFIAAGIRNGRGVLWWMWLLTLVPWWLPAGHPRPGLTTLAFGAIALTAAAVTADALGGRGRARLALADAAERAEAETARRAILEERAKIARELHDVVAHHLSLIAVRADAAPYRLTRLADDARAEFSDLGETAREALTEMRRLLGVLRTGQTAEHAPQPQFTDLTGLVDAVRDAGLAVELTQTGPVGQLPAAVGMCAFRMVQESLSNAGRHAPGAVIRVDVSVEPHFVQLKVSNGPPAAALSRATAGTKAMNGHGLAGMRERVTLLGGTFTAGPTVGGGFEVAAELPTGGPA